MEITDIRIKLVQDSGDRLKAVCSVTFDGSFVVRDVKVVAGTNGLFVAMPSRKLMVSCPTCRFKNHLRAKHCNECGGRLSPQDAAHTDSDGRNKLHRDIAHPITPEFRSILQTVVIKEYEAQLEEAEGADAAEEREHKDDGAAREETPKRDAEQVARDEDRPREAERGARDKDRTRDADPVVPEEDRPREEEEQPAEASRGTEEYNAMIADLRGGRGSGGGGGGGRQREDRGRSDDRPRGRKKEARPAREPRRDVVEKPKVEEKVVEKVAEKTAPPPRKPRVREEAPDAVALEETAAEPASSDDINEDSTPFGLGVL